MTKTIDKIKVPYPTEGVIRTDQLNDTVVPEKSVQLAVNLHFDQIGSATTRLGMAEYADTQASSIKSFGTLNSQASATKYLFAHVGSTIRAYNTTTDAWATVRSSLTGSAKARFSQFLNRTWMVNGNAGDVPKTSNGGAFDTTDVPATFPKADFIDAGYGGRVWVADSSNDILYYTDIVQSTDGITYDTPLTFDITTNFISKFSPQDGESITGLFRVPKALLLFKQNHIYRVYDVDNVDPYPAYNVGTYSQESIVQTKGGIFFHHPSGFYKFTYDSQPTEISRRVKDFVKAIPRSAYENIVGVYDGFDAVKWSIGEVTVEGVTYSNCQMRYSISTQVWTIYDYANREITAMISFDDGDSIEQIAGTSDGEVAKLDSGTTDLGDPISYEVIDRWRSFTEFYSSSKKITGFCVLANNGSGSLLQYQIDKGPANKWWDLGTVGEEYVSMFPNSNTVDFNIIRTRIRGYTIGEPIVFDGIEILKMSDEGYNTN